MKQKPMTLLDFQTQFPSDDACRAHLFAMRFARGFRCPTCGHDQYYEIAKRHLYQCQVCRHQTSVTAGTIFHKTRTDLRKWFWALYLVAHDKRGCSAVTLQRELGVTYKTAWLMLHKIRQAMQDREQHYVLSGIVELDEAYFGGPGEGGKRGRGTSKTPVLVSLSLNSKGNPLYTKMKVVPDVKGITIEAFVKQAVSDDAVLVSDGAKAYQKLGGEYKAVSMRFDPKQNPDHLQWLHKIISNAKSFIAGTYHGLGRKHLQRYLNEFCFRFNRRRFEGEWFKRLLEASISSNPFTYAELTA